jgi:hypothetical protein
LTTLISPNSLAQFNQEREVIMKLITPILAITTLLTFAALPVAHAQADSSAVKAKLKQLEDDWAKAQMDKDHGAAVVEGLLAADYSGVSSRGEVQNKAERLKKIKADTDTYTSAVNDSMEVNLYGPNVATVCGKSTEKGKDKDGKEFTRSYAWVDTWMERNGKWECIAGSGTLLTKK